MIDQQTGYLILSNTLTVKPGDALDGLLDQAIGERKVLADRGNGWQELAIKNVRVDQQYCLLSFNFYKNTLRNISLIVSMDRFDLDAGWETWSETRELDLLKTLRTWVHKELGREGAFPWGHVRVNYNSKGGSSSITLTYKLP